MNGIGKSLDLYVNNREYHDTVESAYKVYVCPRGNLLYMRINLITDLKLLYMDILGL